MRQPHRLSKRDPQVGQALWEQPMKGTVMTVWFSPSMTTSKRFLQSMSVTGAGYFFGGFRGMQKCGKEWRFCQANRQLQSQAALQRVQGQYAEGLWEAIPARDCGKQGRSNWDDSDWCSRKSCVGECNVGERSWSAFFKQRFRLRNITSDGISEPHMGSKRTQNQKAIGLHQSKLQREHMKMEKIQMNGAWKWSMEKSIS